MRQIRYHSPLLLTLILAPILAVGGCDHGLSPPDAPQTGTITVQIRYRGHPESWPAAESLHDLLFVAMRFVPRDTTDFLQLNRLVFSEKLRFFVEEQTVSLPGVEIGPFFYSGVAWKFGTGLFEWRPVGLVEDNGGVFVVRAGDTTFVEVVVDFSDPPPFPPEP